MRLETHRVVPDPGLLNPSGQSSLVEIYERVAVPKPALFTETVEAIRIGYFPAGSLTRVNGVVGRGACTAISQGANRSPSGHPACGRA